MDFYVLENKPLAEFDNETLVAKAINGDRAAFALLLRQNYILIYKIAYKWCGHKSDAEDITQDVCLKLASAIKHFDGKAKFTSWLYRVVLNSVKDMQRSSISRNKRHEAFAEINQKTALPEQEDIMFTLEIWQAVKKLPQKQCDAVLLVYAQELNHAEAAQIMNVKESTISWYIMEAKKNLKGIL